MSLYPGVFSAFDLRLGQRLHHGLYACKIQVTERPKFSSV